MSLAPILPSRVVRLLVLTLSLPVVVHAQAPRVTPAGDPSVSNDTVYALAVDSAAHANDGWIYLLDDGIVRVERDGRTTRTFRQVVQVLTHQAAEQWGERSFSYDPQYERLQINWVRVLRPDGTVLSSQPVYEHESNAQVTERAPVYTHRRVRRLSLGGVSPNTIVDVSYTIERLKPAVRGDFLLSWNLGWLTRRSRFIVDLPVGLKARIVEHNVETPRSATRYADRQVLTWTAREVPRPPPEPFVGVPSDVDPEIDVAGPLTWSDIGLWYVRLLADRFVVTDSLLSLAASQIRNARTFEDSLRAMHRWVAQEFRYVSLSLGVGGYLPRMPAAVLDTRYGDCKDKTIFFVAIARRMGWEAAPVLTSGSGAIDSTLPSLDAFDHMIAAVRHGGAWRFADVTAAFVPFGELPPAIQGRFGLLLLPDGRSEQVTLPRSPPAANRLRSRIELTIDSTGVISGVYRQEAAGNFQYTLRSAFAAARTPEERAQAARTVVGLLFDGAVGDSLDVTDPRDLTATPRIAVHIHNGRVVSGGRGSWILTLPAEGFAAAAGVVANELDAARPRRYPIDIGQVTGGGEAFWELEATLPAGWQARVPEAVHASSPYGEYESSYVQEGRALRVTRVLQGRDRIVPPDDVGALIEWLRDVARDDVRVVVIDAHP